MSSKAKILATGSILRMVEFFAVALVTLAMTPFIIHSLGDKMYGLWIFVGSFLGYYGLMDFGFNSAVQRFLSRAIGLKDDLEANKVINTAIYVFAALGTLVFILSFILAYIMPVLIKNITEIFTFRVVVIILGVNFALGFPMRIFYGILTSHLRYEISTMVEIIKLIIRTILIIFFLKKGYGLITLAFITFVMDIGGYLVRYFIVKKLYPYIVFSSKYFERSKIRSLFGYSVYTFISQIADQLRFNIDNLVITAFMGLSAVTLYSIAARLIKYFMDFVGSAIGMLTPVFSQYEACGDYNSIREKFMLTTKVSCYLSIMIGGLIIMFGHAFIQRWVGERYINAYPILVILTLPMILALMQTPSIQLLYGISKHKFFTVSNSCEGIANIILSIVLVKKFGLLGVALGTAVPMVIVKLFIQPIFTCKAIGLSVRTYYLGIIIPAALGSSIIFAFFWILLKNFIFPNYPVLLILMAVVVVLFMIFTLFVGFGYFERKYFKKIIFNQ
jgi:O-antigen/teichoic acid export membrane protein